MTFDTAKLGADPKKLVVLGVLVVAAAYFYFSNRTPSGPESSVPHPAAVSDYAPLPGSQKATTTKNISRSGLRVTQKGVNSSAREFRPSFKPKDVDTSMIDPELHLALLAKLQNVKAEAGNRSLFEISTGPGPTDMTKIKEPPPIAISRQFVGPRQPPPPPPPPAPPKAPAIPLKFYGFVNPAKTSIKRAFFMDGEDIVIAGEGELIKKRYKIIRIGVNSAVVEDTQFKTTENSQQTLPLEAEMTG